MKKPNKLDRLLILLEEIRIAEKFIEDNDIVGNSASDKSK